MSYFVTCKTNLNSNLYKQATVSYYTLTRASPNIELNTDFLTSGVMFMAFINFEK